MPPGAYSNDSLQWAHKWCKMKLAYEQWWSICRPRFTRSRNDIIAVMVIVAMMAEQPPWLSLYWIWSQSSSAVKTALLKTVMSLRNVKEQPSDRGSSGYVSASPLVCCSTDWPQAHRLLDKLVVAEGLGKAMQPISLSVYLHKHWMALNCVSLNDWLWNDVSVTFGMISSNDR